MEIIAQFALKILAYVTNLLNSVKSLLYGMLNKELKLNWDVPFFSATVSYETPKLYSSHISFKFEPITVKQQNPDFR